MWNVGLTKGLTTYVKETYDQEREKIEQDLAMKNKLAKNTDITQQNYDLYVMDELSERITNDEIESEVNDMSHLADDDDFGDNDGDEGFN